MRYFAKIKYLGTDFHGFQVQPDKRTVQGVLCEALSLATGTPCRVTGCSRTDAGVHANEFCITVDSDGSTVPCDKLPLSVARFLPPDLSLYYSAPCADDFHVRYDCKSKEYLYRIKNTPVYDPFEYGRAWFLPRPITESSLDNMRLAANHILGKHDFKCFMADGSDTEDTVRNVHYLNIDKNGDLIEIRISADGFLYNMVRIIVGTLIEVAYGRIAPDAIRTVIERTDRKNAGPTAPACGLFLNKVNY